MKRAIARMQSRWGVGPLGVLAILATFSLTGTTVMYLAHPIMNALLPADAPTALRVTVYLIAIFPVYHVLLFVFAALFGKLRFFWEKEKKLFFLLRRVVLNQRRS